MKGLRITSRALALLKAFGVVLVITLFCYATLRQFEKKQELKFKEISNLELQREQAAIRRANESEAFSQIIVDSITEINRKVGLNKTNILTSTQNLQKSINIVNEVKDEKDYTYNISHDKQFEFISNYKAVPVNKGTGE